MHWRTYPLQKFGTAECCARWVSRFQRKASESLDLGFRQSPDFETHMTQMTAVTFSEADFSDDVVWIRFCIGAAVFILEDIDAMNDLLLT
jgi:hypothetical protein